MNEHTGQYAAVPLATGFNGRSGYTLIELMVSLSISAILMLGLSSALMVGLRSAQPSSSVDSDIQVARVADRILTELALAKSFTKTLESEIEFTVPSQGDSSITDIIRYQWSNDEGFRVKRSINHSPLVVLDPEITIFSLDYIFRSSISSMAPMVESSEFLLIEHDSTPGASLNSFNTSLTRFCAQWFKPNLHPNAISWKITRAEIVIRKTVDTASIVRIGIHAANPVSTWPLGPSLTSLDTSLSILPSEFNWMTFDFPDLPGLQPECGYCLVVAPISPGLHPRVQFETATQPTSVRSHWLTSSDSANSWTPPDSINNMRFRIYGTITTQAW